MRLTGSCEPHVILTKLMKTASTDCSNLTVRETNSLGLKLKGLESEYKTCTLKINLGGNIYIYVYIYHTVLKKGIKENGVFYFTLWKKDIFKLVSPRPVSSLEAPGVTPTSESILVHNCSKDRTDTTGC